MPSELPSDWAAAPLSALSSRPISYGVLKPGDFDPVGIPMLRIQDVKTGFDPKSIWKISKKLCDEYRRTIVRKNDIIFSVVGTLGATKIIDEELAGANVSRAFAVIGPNDRILPSFLDAFFRSSAVSKWTENAGRGGAQKVINMGELRDLIVPLPPKHEQERISEILSSVDDCIRATDEVVEQAKLVKHGLMEDLLGADEQTIQLSELCDFITKGSTPTTYGYDWQTSGVPFLRSECVSEDGFSESGLAFISDAAHAAMDRSVIYAGDILITITGNVGRVVVLPSRYPEANINQHIARVRLASEAVDKDYVYHFLSSPSQRAHYESIVTGQAYPQLSLKQIRETEIPLKPLVEQRKIAAILNAADAQIATNKQSKRQLERLKRGLMDDLLTGRVRAVT